MLIRSVFLSGISRILTNCNSEESLSNLQNNNYKLAGRDGKHVDVSGVLKQVQNSECRLRRSKETSMNTDTVIRIYGESADMQNFGKFAKDG